MARAARDDAHRARVFELIWWALAPLVCGTYLAVSSQPWPDRLMDSFIAFASIAAMGVTYSARRRAALAEAAGEE